MIRSKETAAKACRRPYSTMTMTSLEIEVQGSLLAASVIDSSTIIVAAGQELGPSYDISAGTDGNTGKTFSQEWELGF